MIKLGPGYFSIKFKKKLEFINLYLEIKSPKTKKLCFKLEKLGAVGESLLHLCMLNGTPLFIDLAKRLIKAFPNMINDIYVSEDYYGKKIFEKANF